MSLHLSLHEDEMPLVNFRCPEPLIKKARELGLNVSEICRNALREAIEGRKLMDRAGFEPGSSAWQAGILVQARLRPLLIP